MNNTILTVLKTIIAKNGIEILNNSTRVRAFLDDLAPYETKKERTTLTKCLQYNFHAELQKHPNDDDRLRRKQQLSEKLYEEEGIAHDLCNDALDLLEMVYFGKITENKYDKNTFDTKLSSTSNNDDDDDDDDDEWTDFDCLIADSWEYRRNGDYNKAIDALTEAIRIYHDDVYTSCFIFNTYYERANLYRDEGNYERAIADYSAAIQLTDSHDYKYISIYLCARGSVYYEKGEYGKAIADYSEAIRIDPSETTFRRRGDFYFARHEYDNAITDYSEAIRLDYKRQELFYSCDEDVPDIFTKNFYSRGCAYTEKKEYDKAIADFNEAISLCHEHFSFDTTASYSKTVLYLYGRGCAYAGKGEYDKAITDFVEALRYDKRSTSTEAINNRKKVFTKLDEVKKIIENDNAH
jgi:tetratricopeptide (TPR) repeat protein